MFEILETPRKIAAAMKVFEAGFRKDALVLNGLGGEVLFHRRTGTWGHFARWKRHDSSTRYWNAFGTEVENFRRNITVEMNPDDRRSSRDMQGVFAIGPTGSILLFHRGRLKITGLGVTEAMFDAASGLARETLVYADGTTIGAHLVADLETDAEQLHDRIAAFVAVCRRVRIHYQADPAAAAEERDVEEAETSTPEPVGDYPIGSQEARIARRRHGEVQRALTAALDAIGRKHTNARVGRWGPDARTRPPGERILFEIKTEVTASDLQRAVGQLLLYEGLLGKAHRKVLVLPVMPEEPYMTAIAGLSIEVLVFRRTGKGPVFDPGLGAFLA